MSATAVLDRPAACGPPARAVFAPAAPTPAVVDIVEAAGTGSVPRRIRRRRLFGPAAVRCATARTGAASQTSETETVSPSSRTTPVGGGCGRRVFSGAAVRGGVRSTPRRAMRGTSRAVRRPRRLFCAAQRSQLGSALSAVPAGTPIAEPAEVDLTPPAVSCDPAERSDLADSCASPLLAVAQRTLLPAPPVPAAGVPPAVCVEHDDTWAPLSGTAAALSVCDPATVEQDAAAAGVPPAALRRRVARFASANRSAAHVVRSRPDNRC